MAQGAPTGPLASSGKNISQELTGGSVGDPFSNGNPLLAGNVSAEDAGDIIAAGSKILGQMPDGASPTSISGSNNIVSTGGFQTIGFDDKGNPIVRSK